MFTYVALWKLLMSVYQQFKLSPVCLKRTAFEFCVIVECTISLNVHSHFNTSTGICCQMSWGRHHQRFLHHTAKGNNNSCLMRRENLHRSQHHRVVSYTLSSQTQFFLWLMEPNTLVFLAHWRHSSGFPVFAWALAVERLETFILVGEQVAICFCLLLTVATWQRQ